MEWSEIRLPNKRIPSPHVLAETPIGELRITWKTHKNEVTYEVEIAGTCLGFTASREHAKEMGREYLVGRATALQVYLNL